MVNRGILKVVEEMQIPERRELEEQENIECHSSARHDGAEYWGKSSTGQATMGRDYRMSNPNHGKTWTINKNDDIDYDYDDILPELDLQDFINIIPCVYLTIYLFFFV